MIQCKDCEFYQKDEVSGQVVLRCDPFETIKEAACLEKHQLMRVEKMAEAQRTILEYYHEMSPMQQMMYDLMKREVDDFEEGERWKYQTQDEEDEL